MEKDIKIKQTKEKYIKTLDKSVIYSQRIKDKMIDTKDKEKDTEENQVQYATDSVTYSAGNITKKGT